MASSTKSGTQTAQENGSVNIALDAFDIDILCKPTPVLTSIQVNSGEIARGRVAIAEAYNSETKNRITLTMSFLNRCWLLTDLTADVDFADGRKETARLHPALIGMNAKFPKHAFDLDPSWIKGFTKKSESDVRKDLASSLEG